MGDDATNKYLSPVTVEAEMFLNSLESLSTHYKNVDVVLVSTLEKIMNAIENFLDSAPTEIIETEKSKLVKLDNINQISRNFNCSLCRRDIGKSVEKLTLHLVEDCSMTCKIPKIEAGPESRKNSKQQKELKLTKKTRCLLTTNLSHFIEDHLHIGTKFKNLPAYEKIEKELFRLATPLFPNQNVHVYKFGSRIAGTGNRDSDLDLYMDIGDTFHVHQNCANNEAIQKLITVEKALKKDFKFWKILRAIKKARVPILRVLHTETGIECDINFSNSLGVVNTKLLEYIFNLQPIARSICILMKKWLSRTKLNEFINTYSMSLTIIFFLQTLNLVPSIEQLQQKVNQEKALKVGPWLCAHSTYSSKDLNIQVVILDQPNLLKYIRSFFNFYQSFNFQRHVICPYLGKAIKTADLENLMPSRYTDYVERFPEYKLQMNGPMIVQDPFQLNYNTTKNVTPAILEIFRQHIVSSLELLNDYFLID